MLGIKKLNTTLSVLTGVALICAASISAAAAGVVGADINVRGDVTVNDQPAVSSSTIVTGSMISTGADSGAMIGIGGNGRIELMPETNLTLEYGSNTISAVLTSGAIRVSNAIGVATTVTTPNAVISADAGRSNTFLIDSSNNGRLTEGKLTIVIATDRVKITAANGRVVSLASGESVVQDDDADDNGNNNLFLIGLALAGAGAAVFGAYKSLNNDPQNSSQTVTVTAVSPMQ